MKLKTFLIEHLRLCKQVAHFDPFHRPRGQRTFNKIFEVGSPKTGTTSLGNAFKKLALTRKGWDPYLYEQCKRGDFTETFEVANMFDTFVDGPWHDFDLYQELDRRFPGSKFILLERDLDEWSISHEKYFSADINASGIPPAFLIRNYKEMQKQIIAEHLEKYKNVKAYFNKRPQDLLIMNVCRGDGWEKLCPFLGFSTVSSSFPCDNKSSAGSLRVRHG